MKRSQTALAGLVALLGLVLAVAAEAQAPPAKKPPASLQADVAKASKQKEEVVAAVFKALGPAVRDQLRAGRKVDLPGLGVFQVVKVAEHRDLVGGIPATIPARNFIEFVPAANLAGAANAPGAVPARTIEGYDFRVNPSAASGLKTEGLRVPRSRTSQ